MKKVLFALVMVLALAECSFAEHRVGVLERIKLSPEKLAELISKNAQIFSEFSNNPQKPAFKFYRSLNEMVLALNAGDIDEVTLPEAVADYILSNNPEYFINCLLILRELRVMLSFGFKDDRKELAESFNKALRGMKQDGTLAVLQSRYIHPDSAALTNADTITPPVFRKFEDAPTIRAAITGDLPPIDYIAADGKPEGFNVAILAEICARLGLNVEILSIESGARAAALASGRADVVFWFDHVSGSRLPADIPEGVILSEPYYSFNKFYHLTKKAQ